MRDGGVDELQELLLGTYLIVEEPLRNIYYLYKSVVDVVANVLLHVQLHEPLVLVEHAGQLGDLVADHVEFTLTDHLEHLIVLIGSTHVLEIKQALLGSLPRSSAGSMA